MIKNFHPFYLSLGFLMATGSLASKEAEKPQNLHEKYEQEIMKLMEEFAHAPTSGKTSPVSQATKYLESEYGPLAPPLNKLRQLLESSRQETIAGVQAFKDVDINNIFADDIFFDRPKMIDKKKKLERLSTFLDESEKRTEKAYSVYHQWITSSPELEEVLRKPILEGSHQWGAKGAAFRKESFEIKKNLIRECIKVFDLLTRIYGTYQKGENSLILCPNQQDALTLNSSLSTISDLFQAEQNLAIQWQQNMLQMEEAFIEVTKMDPNPALMSEEYIQAESLLKCFAKFKEFCQQEGAVINQAYDEAIVNNICTEEAIFDLTKLKEKRKRVDQIGVIFDESEKKWGKQISDLLATKSSSLIDDQGRKHLEFLEKTVAPRMKQSLVLKQAYIIELKKLLDFFLMRHGSYKKVSAENQEFRFAFQFDIEGKIYENYMTNIGKLLRENDEADLRITDGMVEFSQQANTVF
jgi:hypothetical protein